MKRLKVGDRVVVPFTISCGDCFFCERQEFSLCENTNPTPAWRRRCSGHSPCGIFGYSHLTGGYAGGQAEYARVPFADVGPIKIESDLPDEKVLFLSDIFPTGYMAAENCNIQPGDTVAIWGCGPVGLFAIKSACMLGAGRVIAIDRVPERLRMAREDCGAETIDYAETQRADGAEGDDRRARPGLAASTRSAWKRTATASSACTTRSSRRCAWRPTGRSRCARRSSPAATAARCRCPACTAASSTRFRWAPFMNKGLTIKTGQTHMQRYMRPLLERVQKGEIDPTLRHHPPLPLDEAPRGYKMFRDKQDECIKVVLKP